MNVAGIIGGLSPESTCHYYKWLCDGVRAQKGGLHYPEILMATINQQFIYENKKAGDWAAIAERIVAKASVLERAGADFLLIASNTMHNVSDQVEAAINIPLLHIADTTAAHITQVSLSTVGMVSTIESAEMDFYKERLRRQNIEVLVPAQKNEREKIDKIINDELCKGKVNPDSKVFFIDQANALFARGAQGLILGCTEIDMLVDQKDFARPVFDTTRIHVDEALGMILSPHAPAPA